MEKFLSVLSLVLGLLSILCCCSQLYGLLMALAGLVCGITGLVKICADPLLNMMARLKNIATAGIVTSILGFSIGLAVNVLIFWGSLDPESMVSFGNLILL